MNLFWKVEQELPAAGKEKSPEKSGSKGTLSLRPDWNMPEIRTISAIRALVECGQPLLEAKRAIERAMEHGETKVTLEGNDFTDLVTDLAACGFVAGAVLLQD